MRVFLISFSLIGLALVAGCSDPGSDADGKAKTGEEMTQTSSTSPRVAAKVGDQLTSAHFGGAEFADSILDNDKTVIVDFTATWCGPCQKLKPILHELEEEGMVQVVMVDTDDNPEIATAFGVSGIPHLAFVKDGKLVDTSIGYKEKDALVSIIEELGSH